MVESNTQNLYFAKELTLLKRKAMTLILLVVLLLLSLIAYQIYNHIPQETIIFTFAITGMFMCMFMVGVQND